MLEQSRAGPSGKRPQRGQIELARSRKGAGQASGLLADRSRRKIYSGAVSPYREAAATEIMEATTREGLLRLEVAPRHTVVKLGEHLRFSVAESLAIISGMSRHNRRKKRSLELKDARLLTARAVPTQELGIWYSPERNIATRLFGCRPLDLLDKTGLEALRQLDRLSKRLSTALTPYHDGVIRAIEIGPGADRVLITDDGDRLVFYVRRLFRDSPQRALEVSSDGTIVLLGKGRFRSVREEKIKCTSRYGVTSIGDYVRFADQTGEDMGSVAIPWVTAEERQEIVEIIGQRIDPLGPVPGSPARIHS